MDYAVFGVCLMSCCAAATTGAAFPPGAWYLRLDRPSWTPPNWLFPVAWTTLYVLMSIAAARIAPKTGSGLPMALWALQIALNTLWTPVFFGLRRFGGAAIVVVGLWLAVAATMVTFWELDSIAGWMLAPYLVWCTVAAALNIAMWRRNPDIEPLNMNA